MKLTQKAIKAVKSSTPTKLRIALELDITEQWVNESLLRNKENGPLTTVAALRIITNDTGLSQQEILEGDDVLLNA